VAARDEYRIRRLGLAGKYRIGLNAVRTGKIGVKGLVVEYGGYSGEYSPTPSLKLLARLSVIRVSLAFLCAWVLELVYALLYPGYERSSIS